MQEEIEQKSFNIMISTTKLSARTVLRAVKAAFRLYQSKTSQGKQSVRTLLRQNQGGKGTVAGIIRISNDGKNWKEVERFEFGNLINDPSKRYHHFKQTVKARYVQVEAAEIAARTEAAALAEIDLF